MLIKKFLASFLVCSMITSNMLVGQCGGTRVLTSKNEIETTITTEETIVMEEEIPTPDFQRFEYQMGLSKEEIENEISTMQEYLIYLTQFDIEPQYYEMEEHSIRLVMALYNQDISYYEKWEEKSAKYPEATKVWLYMKEYFGWSDEVCAGIMGNIMAEIGGGASEGALGFGEKWKIDKSSGMGMFQWTSGRRKEIKSIYGNNPTIEQQLEFMYDELYGTDGVTKQVKDSELEKILNGQSPESIAYSFATYFERCDPAYRSARKNYARFAYNYFTK